MVVGPYAGAEVERFSQKYVNGPIPADKVAMACPSFTPKELAFVAVNVTEGGHCAFAKLRNTKNAKEKQIIFLNLFCIKTTLCLIFFLIYL